MKPLSTAAVSSSLLPTSVRQLRMLLLGLLTFGLFLALPSAQATTTHAIEGESAERLLTSTPFIVATNDLLRQFRGTDTQLGNTDCGPDPLELWLLGTASAAVVAQTPRFTIVVSNPSSRPARCQPGAPRGPPSSPQ